MAERLPARAAGPVRDPSKPHLRLSAHHRACSHFFPAKWHCAAIFGEAGYGLTQRAAYLDWMDRNLINLDGPRRALRVRPSIRERMAIAELKELLIPCLTNG